jgi:hypothetical protein
MIALITLNCSAFGSSLRNPAEATPAPSPTVIPKQEVTKLRSRERLFTFDYRQFNDTTDKTVGVVELPTVKSKGYKAGLEFGHNYGLIQTSLLLGRSLETVETGPSKLETDSILYGLGFRYNFIENTPGNDLIPYAKAKLGILTIKTSDFIAKPMTVHGSENGLSIGLDWFPFSEVFAVNFELYQTKAKAKTIYLGTPIDINKDGFGSAIGFNLYF